MGCVEQCLIAFRVVTNAQLIYLTFAAFPLVWEGVYGLKPGDAGLPFLSILVGAFISVPVSLYFQQRYVIAVRRTDGHAEPELRLPQAALGGLLIAISFFWFGWSGYRAEVSIWAPISSGVVLGLGNVLIFRCVRPGLDFAVAKVARRALQTFLIDVYQDYSASAQSANVIVRSAFGAVFRSSCDLVLDCAEYRPALFATQMFNNVRSLCLRWLLY